MRRLEFFVEGHPQTAGSKTAIPNPKDPKRPFVVESGDRKAKRTWREDLRAVARESVGEDWPMAGPFAATFVFHRLRPKSHYGSGRNRTLVKSSAPVYPDTRPDALKLARAVEDALTAILWHDDAAIVDERLQKVFGPREGVAVVVVTIEDEQHPVTLFGAEGLQCG